MVSQVAERSRAEWEGLRGNAYYPLRRPLYLKGDKDSGSDSDLFSYPSLQFLPTIYVISQPGLTFPILSQQMSLDLCR